MYHFFTRIFFIIGFLIGVFLAVLVIKLTENKGNSLHFVKIPNCKTAFNGSIYKSWFASSKLIRKRISFDVLRYSRNKITTESQYLFEKIKVLCLLLVRNLKNAEAAKNTWGQNCNKIDYMYINVVDKKRKIIPIKKTKNNSSWVLLCKALLNISEDYNWILIVHDDTFAIVENLRLLVAGLDDSEGHYLGHPITFWAVTYNMGQAGYVLSRGSIDKLKSKFNTTNSCTSEITYWNQEDMYLGKHLASLNITPIDTRDSKGMTRFYPYNWHHTVFPGANYYKFSVFPVSCCSIHSITFQATEAHKMYTYYYLLYHLQIFDSGNLGNQLAPTPVPESEVWQGFLRERGITMANISSKQYYKIWEDLVHDPTAFAQELRREKYDFY